METFVKCFSIRALAAALGAILLVPAALGQTLTSGEKALTFPKVSREMRGVQIHSKTPGAEDAYAAQPVQLLVCSTCSDESTNQAAIGPAYTSVQEANDSVLATARVTSPNGSSLRCVTAIEPGARQAPSP